MNPRFERFPARLRELISNEYQVDWPRPRRDRDREPSHPWARMETRRRDRAIAHDWERDHRVIFRIPDEVLMSINSLEIVGIIYLAVAVSKLRSDIARVEGRLQQRERDNGK